MKLEFNTYAIIEIKSLTNGFSLVKRDFNNPIYAAGIDLNSLTIETPLKTCVQGQLVSLEGLLILENRSQAFYSSGKVVEVVPLSLERAQVTIQLYRYDRREWEKLINKMNEEQAVVDSLFASLRGEA